MTLVGVFFLVNGLEMVLGLVDESIPPMFSFLLYGCLGPNLTKVQGLNVFGIDYSRVLLFCKTKI